MRELRLHNFAHDGWEGAHMIRVIRKNFQETLVDDHVLDSLISTNRLIAFKRSKEWVVVGKDTVRGKYTFYPDDERRRIVYGNNFCMK
jgi:hypothetical protein